MLRHLSLPALLTLTCAQAPDAEPPVRELGQVEWNEGADGLERAKMLSAIDKKPVFLLFQEIPGCATCRNFGDGPLSHPLLVEAIETLFHPAAVHNNRGGADARVLKEFNEPSWNNPVVRFVDAMGDDILPRRDRVWTTAGIAQRAVQALEKKKLEVPAWLALVEQETSEERPAIATFSMHCFWEGEVHLGAVDGVTQVRAGWLDGREVVEATYLPSRVALVDLTKAAKASGCATRVHVRTDAEAQEVRAAGVA
ncbi:MAG: VPGUxxT family thioredoxin-like (seleno)protein, type 2, partial [Planctomycetota bacterium]